MSPIIYVVCGPPSSGKSCGIYKFMHKHYLKGDVVDMDAVRREYMGDAAAEDLYIENREIARYCRNRIKSTLYQHRHTFFISLLPRAENRQLLYQQFQKFNVPIIFVYFNTSLNRCLLYNHMKRLRSKGCISDEHLIDMYYATEPITRHENLNFIYFTP